MKDITEQERTESRLAAERERLAVTLRSIGDAVIATDGEARITLFNDVAATLTGWRAAEAIGRPIDQVFISSTRRRASRLPTQSTALSARVSSLDLPSTPRSSHGTDPAAHPQTAAPLSGTRPGASAAPYLSFATRQKSARPAWRFDGSEERYRGLFENIAEEVTIYEVLRGDGGEIVDWVVREQNKQARSFGGAPAQGLEGSRLTDILGKDVALPFIEKSREVMHTGAPSSAELHLDLTGRHYHASLFKLDENTLVAAALDVTQWKLAEEALAASEHLHRSLFTLAPSGVLLITGLGVLTFNDRAASQLGYTREEFARLNVSDIDAEENSGEVEAHIARVLAGGEEEFEEARQRTRGGDVRNVLVSVRPVSIGREKCVLSVMQDQTERKRAADAIRESEERFRVAFQTSPDSVNLNRLADGGYVAVNEGFTRLTGWTAEEVIGRTSAEIGIWADAADRERLVAGLRRTASWRTWRRASARKDGTSTVGLMSARLVRLNGEEHHPHHHPRHRRMAASGGGAEAAPGGAGPVGAHGGHRPARRGRGPRLQQPAHRGPELRRVPPDRLRGRPRRRQGGRGRDPGRGGAGPRPHPAAAHLRAAPVHPARGARSCNDVVRGSERLLRRVLGEVVELRVASLPSSGRARFDRGQMEQVIMNLAVNARDAMPAGGTLALETTNLAVRRRVGPGRRRYVALRVRDTGTGLSPEARAHLFEPFFTTKAKGKGTGLGLATVYGIVKQSGGSIRWRASPGAGRPSRSPSPRTLDQPVAPRPDGPHVLCSGHRADIAGGGRPERARRG